LFQCDCDLTGVATLAARRLFIGPLAGYVSRESDKRNDKQKCRYKKQLFGHSTIVGDPFSLLVTARRPEGCSITVQHAAREAAKLPINEGI
jgi:hypothetical protein